ncbi:MAG: peptidoglycan DD-metalloendopeptidase family protein [Ruminococcus sp.]|nr:peptidoglycan DD-metalloendopeptidase family protein [Ruminococcus sp.]
MKTKFIGLEGFNEIESLSTSKRRRSKKLNTAQKSVRFIKRAVTLAAVKLGKKSSRLNAQLKNRRAQSRTAIIDKHYSANRASAKSEFSGSLRGSLTKVYSTNAAKHAHSAPSSVRRAHSILKKRAVLAVVASLSAVMLSCATVASALDEPVQKVEKPEPKAQISLSMAQGTTAPSDAIVNVNVNDDSQNSPVLFMTNAFSGLYIDGEFIGAAQTDALSSALDSMLVDYRARYDDETTTEFFNDVELVSGSYDENEIMTVDEVLAKADGKFSISLSTDIIYTNEIYYDTTVEYDEDKEPSYEEVKTPGENGLGETTVRTTYVDGVLYDAVVTDTKVSKEPVNEVIVKGAKGGIPEEDTTQNTGAAYGTATGGFIWPAPHTRGITTYYEWRWGSFHYGIDIAGGGDYGQPILASDSGTVVFSGYDNSGYGNYVIIDHGNGYKTLYGHACELAVSTGEYVAQGQTIAYIGSTGFSTGPHLHFEIIENGEKVDPLNYVS